MSLIENEQTKLLAANIDRASSAFIIAGFVTPVVALSYQFPASPPVTVWAVAFSLIWLAVGIGLHLAARHVLRRLKASPSSKATSCSAFPFWLSAWLTPRCA